MSHPYAFFDVDSIELSTNGRIFTCHSQVSSISSELYEIYSIISSIAAPYIFSIDVHKNAPNKNSQRSDFLTIPESVEDYDWKKSVSDRFKFFVQRTATNYKEKDSIFINNKNILDCVKLIKAKEWIVFGNGFKHNVDHVINTLLELGGTVKFVPELIVPGESESWDDLETYFESWMDKGVVPMNYLSVIELARHQKR